MRPQDDWLASRSGALEKWGDGGGYCEAKVWQREIMIVDEKRYLKLSILG